MLKLVLQFFDFGIVANVLLDVDLLFFEVKLVSKAGLQLLNANILNPCVKHDFLKLKLNQYIFKEELFQNIEFVIMFHHVIRLTHLNDKLVILIIRIFLVNHRHIY